MANAARYKDVVCGRTVCSNNDLSAMNAVADTNHPLNGHIQGRVPTREDFLPRFILPVRSGEFKAFLPGVPPLGDALPSHVPPKKSRPTHIGPGDGYKAQSRLLAGQGASGRWASAVQAVDIHPKTAAGPARACVAVSVRGGRLHGPSVRCRLHVR